MIPGLLLVLFQGQGPDVTEALAQGRHQLAMAAAARLEPGAREAAEAEVLYLARSYDEALDKVREALDHGSAPDCTLLSRGVSAAIWTRDVDAGSELLQALDGAIEGLPEGERPAWQEHARELEGFLGELEAGVAETDAALARSRNTAGVAGLGAILMLALALRSWREG